MARYQITSSHSNVGIFGVVAVCFVGLLLLFGWQTWEFVNWLFPTDQMLMKGLTLFSFDVMCFIWTIAKQFYRFAHPNSKAAAGWGKWVTFTCSLVASVIYMMLVYILRFQGTVTPGLVSLSEFVAMAVLVFNILMAMVFLGNEISTRFPNVDEYVLVDMPQQRTRSMLQVQPARNQVDFLSSGENQDENDENQLEKGPQYTHNKPVAGPNWGGKREKSGRKKEEE